jgi:hypothetical protein
VRHDIREGADFDEMPAIGFGRIIGSHDHLLREWYCTIRIAGVRYFAACGRYDFRSRSWRFWKAREVAAARA